MDVNSVREDHSTSGVFGSRRGGRPVGRVLIVMCVVLVALVLNAVVPRTTTIDIAMPYVEGVHEMDGRHTAMQDCGGPGSQIAVLHGGTLLVLADVDEWTLRDFGELAMEGPGALRVEREWFREYRYTWIAPSGDELPLEEQPGVITCPSQLGPYG